MSNFDSLDKIFEELDDNSSKDVLGGGPWINWSGVGKIGVIVGSAIEGTANGGKYGGYQSGGTLF